MTTEALNNHKEMQNNYKKLQINCEKMQNHHKDTLNVCWKRFTH